MTAFRSDLAASETIDIAQLGRAADLLVARGRTDLATTVIEAIFVLCQKPAALGGTAMER